MKINLNNKSKYLIITVRTINITKNPTEITPIKGDQPLTGLLPKKYTYVVYIPVPNINNAISIEKVKANLYAILVNRSNASIATSFLNISSLFLPDFSVDTSYEISLIGKPAELYTAFLYGTVLLKPDTRFIALREMIQQRYVDKFLFEENLLYIE